MIADHPLIMDIQQKDKSFSPVYLPPDADELTRENIARQMHAGAVDFARQIKPFATCNDFYLSSSQLIEYLNCFMKFAPQDKKAFQGITVPFGLKNEKKRFVVAPYFSLKVWLKKPLKCFKIYRKSLIK